jgi:hypothetical protein
MCAPQAFADGRSAAPSGGDSQVCPANARRTNDCIVKDIVHANGFAHEKGWDARWLALAAKTGKPICDTPRGCDINDRCDCVAGCIVPSGPSGWQYGQEDRNKCIAARDRRKSVFVCTHYDPTRPGICSSGYVKRVR